MFGRKQKRSLAERNKEVWQKETKMFGRKKQRIWRKETRCLAQRNKEFGIKKQDVWQKEFKYGRYNLRFAELKEARKHKGRRETQRKKGNT